MKTAQERIESMHWRAAQLRRRRENAALGQLGAVCGMLALCLIGMAVGMSQAHTGISPGAYTGTAMLFESAGGYVLVGVIAFMAGVALTAALIRRRKRKGPPRQVPGGGEDRAAE